MGEQHNRTLVYAATSRNISTGLVFRSRTPPEGGDPSLRQPLVECAKGLVGPTTCSPRVPCSIDRASLAFGCRCRSTQCNAPWNTISKHFNLPLRLFPRRTLLFFPSSICMLLFEQKMCPFTCRPSTRTPPSDSLNAAARSLLCILFWLYCFAISLCALSHACQFPKSNIKILLI